MRRFSLLALVLALVMTTTSSSIATVSTIETRAPLQDHAEESVRIALLSAVEAALTGAVAMGLVWVRISQALVLEDAVAVQILATDMDPEPGTGEEGPGSDSESSADVL
jgi:hypothetical protein